MKKKIALALTTIMAMSAMSFTALAEDNNVNLKLNGVTVESDQPAVIVEGRTMVPLRVIAEALGCEVEWDAETKTVKFAQNDLTASMTVGEAVLNVSDGTTTYPVEIDQPAIIMNGRTMVPVRFLSETFDCEVEWDAATKTANIVSDYIGDTVATPSAVETPAAVEYEGMDDSEVKDSADEADTSAAVLNEENDKISADEKEA